MMTLEKRREALTSGQAEAPIIQVEGVYKQYARVEYRPSLRHEALSLLRRAFRKQVLSEPFYALQNVSFSVRRGESVAIVGRNGSGKTTLLKLLSGIMRPTQGRVRVRGRFASLIGLQAGFLPELSGRKNIYLNAAFHGVMPRQIEPYVESIIEFAEIRPFIDTPVKHYSSGMSTRLGFSIAIHVLPEIIFLDEVLAVGDAAFQQKCVEHMLKLRDEGRTILFVSHDAGAVRMLCQRALWLHKGRLRMDGGTDVVLEEYEYFVQHQRDEA
ncbi:MAG: ABC transporter ATP-binding protein [Candidatus Thermofonsia Clade 1 bacterium]|jgi:ABC-type polysaccharide/polyol phosphate transport system ATPase subunit|uniref:ABC transporter ATP-binding protein n=2 Tax=Candidatus Thermofonsia Clade 1 bacterium TaxID=2364210 RepID=A0A2M8PXD1_9CHLR|nr:MAG: ABC transporter ATP-binding protein [Candidatus Thermofonsia Clade 1 bacterium]